MDQATEFAISEWWKLVGVNEFYYNQQSPAGRGRVLKATYGVFSFREMTVTLVLPTFMLKRRSKRA